MLATLRQRNFALLWFAGLVSMTGDWVLITALPFYVYERTDSTLASGLVLAAYFAPGLLFGSVAGVFVDRWDRRRTMVGVDVLQALVMLGLLIARVDGWLWVVYVVAFTESTLSQFFGPAENALLPQLVGEERLFTANALNSLNNNLARIIGPSIGGVAVALTGLTGAALINATSFLIAAGLIALIAAPQPPAPADTAPDQAAVRAWASVWQDWTAGLRLVRTDNVLRSLFAIAGVAVLADSVLSALLVPFIEQVVEGGVEAFGFILTVRGIAGVLGGVVIGRFGDRFGPGQVLGWSLIMIGAGVLIEVNFPLIPLVIGMTLLLGPPISGWLTSRSTILQAGTEDRYRGRVFGAFGTSNALVGLVGTGVASVLGDRVGVVSLLNVSAGLYTLAGMLALVLFRQHAWRSTVPLGSKST